MLTQTSSLLDDTFFQELRQGFQAAFSWPSARRPRQVEKTVQRMPEGADPKPPPPGLDHTRLRETVRKALRETGTLAGLTLDEQRYSALVLFHPDGAPHSWIGADKDLRQCYQRWISAKVRRKNVIRLLRYFLWHYPSNGEVRSFWRKALLEILASPGAKRLEQWRERADAYHLLEAEGWREYARGLFDSELSADAYIEVSGLKGSLEACQFLAYVQTAVCDLAMGGLQSTECQRAFDRLVDFAEVDGRLRFVGQRSQVANALLFPFLSASPPARLKESVRQFILKHFGHPTVHQGRWAGVDPECLALFKRWVVAATLDNFFEIVRESALDHQWQHREHFWKAYFERGAIDDAWVAVGPSAAKRGFAFLEEHKGSFGRLEIGLGVEGTQSALIFRIGGCTITEWTHNGKCRIWRRGNKEAPQLGTAAYRGYRLKSRSCDAEFVHAGSDGGCWQRKIADWFRDQLGIDIPASEYLL